MQIDHRNRASLSRKIFKNSSIVLFGQAFSLLANLAVTVMMARYLGEAGFGIFSYGLVFASFFALIADFGMKPIIVRELARDQWEPATFLGTAIIIRFLLSVFAILAALASSKLAGYSGQYLAVIVLLALNILFTAKLSTFRITFEAPFHADIEMHWPMLLRMLDSALALLSIYLCVQFSVSLEIMVAAFVLSNAPGLLLNAILTCRRRPWRFQLDMRALRFLFKESLPICFYTILVTFLGGVDVFLLKAMQGEEAVGLYAAATRLTTPLQFIPHAIVVSLFPIFSRYHEQTEGGVGRAFQLGFKLILLLGLGFAMTTTFLAPKIIALLYTDDFAASAQPFVLLMWSMVFLFLNFYFVDVLTSANLQKASFYVAAIMLLLNFPANWLLIHSHDIAGAAYAKLLAYAVGSAMLIYFVQKKYRFPGTGFWLRMVLLIVTFLAAAYYMQSASVIVALATSVLLFVVLIAALGVFDPEERATFMTLIRRKVRN